MKTTTRLALNWKWAGEKWEKEQRWEIKNCLIQFTSFKSSYHFSYPEPEFIIIDSTLENLYFCTHESSLPTPFSLGMIHEWKRKNVRKSQFNPIRLSLNKHFLLSWDLRKSKQDKTWAIFMLSGTHRHRTFYHPKGSTFLSIFFFFTVFPGFPFLFFFSHSKRILFAKFYLIIFDLIAQHAHHPSSLNYW